MVLNIINAEINNTSHNANAKEDEYKTTFIPLAWFAGAAEAVEAPLDETLLYNCFSKNRSGHSFNKLSCLYLKQNNDEEKITQGNTKGKL